ncbi:hypothetical protein BH11BAC4_BH11BAC4_06730 [soil metagenome]
MRIKLFVLLILLQVSAIAQWSPDPAINNAVCNFAGNQQNEQLVSDGAGGAILTWEDTRNTSTDIYAQRISSTGSLLWAVDGVAICTAGFNQLTPKLIPDGAGGAIITWKDDRNGAGAGSYDIYAQRINAGGMVQWTADGEIICNATGIQTAQQLITDGLGGAIIVWSDGRGGSANADIFTQRINAAGAVQWTANGAAVCTASSLQNIPQLVSDGAGGAIVSWEDWRNFSQPDIYAQRISNGFGSWAFNGVAICSEGNLAQQFNIQMAADGSGGAIMCWQDKRNFGSNTDLYAQKVNSSGSTQWLTDGIVVCNANALQLSQQIISDGAGGAFLVWEDRRNERDIYAQRINTSGISQWTANGIVVCDAAGTQAEPQLAARTSGGAIMLWTDSRNSFQPDIYAQSIDVTGTALWTANGAAVANESHAQFAAQLLTDGADGAVIAWQDLRTTTDYDIYSSRLFANGTLPIHLIDFNVTNGINSVTLSWKTDNEINNRGYEIQRSSNGTNWATADFVAAHTSSAGIHEYQWQDWFPLSGQSYYRLKQIDMDGNFIQTKILPVNRTGRPATVRIYPNPVREFLQVDFRRNIRTGNMQLYNSGGQLLLTRVISLQSSVQINVKQQAAGMYTLKITLPDGESIYKIMIE